MICIKYSYICHKIKHEGTIEVPSFYDNMGLLSRVKELLDEAFDESPHLFLIDVTVTPEESIIVIIDGDEGVTLDDCITISRAVEHQLDREEYDFSLEVTSAGALSPLELPRQYKKNLGRKLEIQTQNGKFAGKLIDVQQNTIEIEWKSREPKEIGKGKTTVTRTETINFEDIEKAVVVIPF